MESRPSIPNPKPPRHLLAPTLAAALCAAGMFATGSATAPAAEPFSHPNDPPLPAMVIIPAAEPGGEPIEISSNIAAIRLLHHLDARHREGERLSPYEEAIRCFLGTGTMEEVLAGLIHAEADRLEPRARILRDALLGQYHSRAEVEVANNLARVNTFYNLHIDRAILEVLMDDLAAWYEERAAEEPEDDLLLAEVGMSLGVHLIRNEMRHEEGRAYLVESRARLAADSPKAHELRVIEILSYARDPWLVDMKVDEARALRDASTVAWQRQTLTEFLAARLIAAGEPQAALDEIAVEMGELPLPGHRMHHMVKRASDAIAESGTAPAAGTER